MEISNDTGQDTRYRVTGTGGSGAGPKDPRPEDTVNWKVIAANSTIRHKPASKAPWRVEFFVDGRFCTAKANSDNDHVQLVAQGNAFQANVQKASLAKRTKADRAVNAV